MRAVFLTTLATCILAGCGQPTSTNLGPKTVAPVVATSMAGPGQTELPTRVRCNDVEDAMSHLPGIDRAYVFRWRKRVLEGWLQFQDAEGIRREPLKGLEKARSLFREDQPFDPEFVSGALVIIVKKPADKSSKFRECQVSLMIEKEFPVQIGGVLNRNNSNGYYVFSGSLQVLEQGAQETSGESGGDMECDLHFNDGKELRFYELKLLKDIGTEK